MRWNLARIEQRTLSRFTGIAMAMLVAGGVAGVVSDSALAAGTISAELDRTRGTLDDAFQLTITISGKHEGDAPPVEIPGAEVQSAGVSRSMQWVNGTFSSEVQFNYIVRPVQEGRLTVPSIRLKIEGEELATLPIPFDVVPGGSTKPAPNTGNQSPPSPPAAGQIPQGQAPPQQQGGVPNTPADDSALAAKGDFFIERQLSRTRIYAGEAVLATSRIYFAGRLLRANPIRESAPEFRSIAVPGERNYQQIVGGRRFSVIELNEVVIPSRAGELVLPPFAINAVTWTPVARRRGGTGSVWDLFSGSMFDMGKEENRRIASDPSKLTVIALPKEGRPESFSGLVGSFNLSASLDPRQIKFGDTTTLTVRLDGSGALDQAPDLARGLESLGRVYADKADLSESVDMATPDTPLRSTRTQKFALIPGTSGSITVPDVEISVFDPRVDKYVTLKAAPGVVQVEPGGATSPQPGSPAVPAPAPDAVAAAKSDLLPLHAVASLMSMHGMSGRDFLRFGAVGGVPVLLALAAFVWRRRREWLIANSADERRRRARRMLEARESGIREAQDAGDSARAVDLLHASLQEFVGDMTGRHARALTVRELSTEGNAELADRLHKERHAEWNALVKDIDGVKYGTGVGARMWTELHQRVVGISSQFRVSP